MKTRRIIEGRWRCGSCDNAGILGRHGHCPTCGSPRESGEMSFDFGATNADGSSTFETVRDADLLARAGEGADWFCAFCSGGNRASFDHCTRCGAGQDGRPPPPPPTPARRAIGWVPKRHRRWVLALSGLASTGVAMCSGAIGVSTYVNRDIEVQARVVERTWHRRVEVERLEPADVDGWKDTLPEPASAPGYGASPSPGLGALYRCETQACWPRPPAKGTTARVTGYSWNRSIKTRVMRSRSGSGWDEKVPSGAGSMPSGGSGGSEGATGESCRSKVRTPEKCRNVSYKEACGTERKCKVVSKGNGFAEEVCSSTTKYCSKSKRECDPEVRDRWCSWTELYWGGGRTVAEEGTDQRPRWPAFSAGPAESASRSEHYAVTLASLAGPAKATQRVTEAELKSLKIGQLIYAGEKTTQVVPTALQVGGERVDCEDGVPRDVLATRDRCWYERWSWVEHPSLTASGTQAAPAWPDPLLADDGREKRSEWVTVRLHWIRGDRSGEKTMSVPTDDFSAWSPGTRVPVKVDSQANFLAFPQ